MPGGLCHAGLAQMAPWADDPAMELSAPMLPQSNDILIGREAELALLEQAVERGLGGHESWLMLAGEPGIGKTRLAEEAATLADQHGMRALWGRCPEEAGAPPFLPWTRALEAALRAFDAPALGAHLGRDAAAAIEIVPGLAQHLGPLFPRLPALAAVDGDQARFRLFMAVAHLWRRLAELQPLLLILDNLHWADPSSLRLLGFLAAELAGQRIVVLGTFRDAELSRHHPLSATLADLLRAPRFVRLQLHRLDHAQTERLIAARGGTALPPATVEVIAQRTEGHPLFVVEMLRLLLLDQRSATQGQPAGHAALHLQVPAGLREMIGQRLNRLSAPCCRWLAMAACIGRVFDVDLLVALGGGNDEGDALAAIDEALAQQVVEARPAGRCQFSHALFRDALYDELQITQRLRWHRAIADQLERRGADQIDAGLIELAYHHANALPLGDPVRALDCALRAARRAAELAAHAEAVRLLRQALQINERYLAAERRQRCDLLLELGRTQTAASDSPADAQTFREALRLARDLGSPALFARAALGLENSGWRVGHPGDEAATLLEQALRPGALLDVHLQVELWSALCRAHIFCDRQPGAEAARQRAVALARDLGEPAPLFRALAAIVPARHWPDRLDQRLAAAREALDVAERAGHLEWLDALTGWYFGDLVEQGDLATAREVVHMHREVAGGLRQPFMQAMGLASLTLLAAYEGRFAAAERLAGETFDLGRRFAPDSALGVFSMQMFTLRRSQGRLGEVLPALRGLLAQGQKSGHDGALWQPGLALICAELALTDEARAAYEPMAARGFAAITRDALWLTNIAFLAEACVRLDDRARAPLLYRLLEPYAGRNIVTGTNVVCHGSADRLLGMLSALAGDTPRAERHLQAAIAADARQGGRPWCAEAQLAYAVLLRGHSGDNAQAQPLLDAALATGRELGMAALERRCLAQGTSATVPPPAPDGLSRREVEVLRLVAIGRSNRAIGVQLYISANTVANHVRGILAKTGSANRTEAAGYASRHGLLLPTDQS